MPSKREMAEAEVLSFRRSLGPFVVAAEVTRMPMAFTIDEGEDRSVIFANPSFLTLFGYKEAEMLGKSFNSLMREGAAPEAFERVDAAFDKEGEVVPEIRYRRKNGGEFWASVLISPVRDELGNTMQHFISVIDLTKHKQEEARIAMLQAEVIHLSRLSAMGAMAATLAHELNQPLGTIVNYAAAAEELIERGAETSELRVPLAQIGKSALRAGDIIRRSRAMSRRGESAKRPFLPEPVVKEAGELASIGACENINLQYEFVDPRPVLGDTVQIQQVLVNLIRNACDAAVSCEDPNVLVRLTVVENNTVISVEDSGTGVAPEDLPLLFDASFSTRSEGMGVGLALSRTIIEAHGGRIWAENRPEGGARFSFTLPMAENEPPEHRV